MRTLSVRRPVFKASGVAMLTPRCKCVLFVWALTSCLFTAVLSQDTPGRTALSPNPFMPSDDGQFDWQEGIATSTLKEGSEMNITWSTSFPFVNLFLIANASWDAPIRIVGTSRIFLNESLPPNANREQ
jgi:hypothetical protein